jgi:FeS assembly protein IscX
MPKLNWQSLDDIAIALYEKFPDQDPTHVRFTDLHKHVIALPDFKDDPKRSSEGKLESIQMAWHTEFLDRTQG